MVMPIYDDNPLRPAIRPYLTWGLIALNVVVFGFELASPDLDAVFFRAGVVPVAVFGGLPAAALPVPATLVSYMFLHADFMHLFGNMIFLWVFGDDIENAMGRWRFLVFYFACGIIAGLAFAASDPASHSPLIGASGAVSGVVAAYLMLRPCAKIGVFVFGLVTRVSAYWVIGAWALWQLFHVMSQASDGVAYWGHVGGFIAGALLFVLMRPADVELFECMQAPEPPAPGAQAGPWGSA